MANLESSPESSGNSTSKDLSSAPEKQQEPSEHQSQLAGKEHLKPVSSSKSDGAINRHVLDHKTRSSRPLQLVRSYGDGHGHVCLPHEKPEPDQESNSQNDGEEAFLVSFDGEDDPMSPRSMTKFRKWLIVIIVSLSSTCV